ncbi:hypothetical protein AB0F13_24645 [Streptomyces sp. NPDC026206]|uniref:hypothetical protein n=1 Tax=Streptomyces sp. NPDC026206 TaxID=3157089 RepID=UPI0033E3D9FE
MTPPLATRIHLVITFALVTCAALGGICFGLLLGGPITAVIVAGAAGLGTWVGSFFARRQIVALFRPESDVARADGYAEGIADGVLVSIATYQAAVFPLTPDGVSEEERQARRTVAYRVSAYDGLPLAVRVSAAEALEAVDQGLDADRAQAAMKALSLTVYAHRGGR